MDRLSLGQVQQELNSYRTQCQDVCLYLFLLNGILGGREEAWVLSLMGVWILPPTLTSNVASGEPCHLCVSGP